MSGSAVQTPALLTASDYAGVFGALPTAYPVLTPDLVIADANEAYLQLLGRTRQELVGRGVFEAFPPTADALDAQGRNPLQLSFERARDTGRPDAMPLHPYAVFDPASGQTVQRCWSLIHAPVLDADGSTRLILQRWKTSPTTCRSGKGGGPP